VLEKQRKDEWAAKELLKENMMEAELATNRRIQSELGEYDEPGYMAPLEMDCEPSKNLPVKSRAGGLPWWREESWLERQGGVRETREMPTDDVRPEERADVSIAALAT
jgi:hypothetical protein